MKLTPVELVQSWNALHEVLKLPENQSDPEFTGQAKNITNDIFIKNEINKWNNLNGSERAIVQDKKIDLDIDKIDNVPNAYPNADIEALQRFIEPKLEPTKTEIDKLLDEASENGHQEPETQQA